MISKGLRNIMILTLFTAFVFLNIEYFQSNDNMITRITYRIVEWLFPLLLNIFMIFIDESLDISKKIYKRFSTNKFFKPFVCSVFIIPLMIIIVLTFMFDESIILYDLLYLAFLALSSLGLSIICSLSKLSDSTNNNQNDDR